jgi:hypothetical protein
VQEGLAAFDTHSPDTSRNIVAPASAGRHTPQADLRPRHMPHAGRLGLAPQTRCLAASRRSPSVPHPSGRSPVANAPAHQLREIDHLALCRDDTLQSPVMREGVLWLYAALVISERIGRLRKAHVVTSETEISRKRLEYKPKRVRILLVGEAPLPKVTFFTTATITFCGTCARP